jgi:hypothetical protein
MSVEIWPPLAPEQLKVEEDATLVSHHGHVVTLRLWPLHYATATLPPPSPCISPSPTQANDDFDDGWLLVHPVTSTHTTTHTADRSKPLPPPPSELTAASCQIHELNWLLAELQATLKTLKSSLEETYALLAPIDPGSTLVVSTPRQEAVKGHVTRVGTRLVKGTIQLRFKTLPPQTLTLDPANPIHVPELAALNTLLTQSVDILSFIVAESSSATATPTNPKFSLAKTSLDPKFLSDQLRLLSEYLAEARALLKGPQLLAPEQASLAAAAVAGQLDTAWTSSSMPPSCFRPPLPGNLSFHLTVQDASLVLCLRSLEPADAPVAFGTKLALAIGTARRLEHDEADRLFDYCPEGVTSTLIHPHAATAGQRSGPAQGRAATESHQVYVREKVRIESADPSLLSLGSKLNSLGHALALARRNLAVVMGDTDEGKEEE